MTSLEWGRLYGVGVEQLDQDHLVVSNLAVQLDDALETDQSRDIVANIISVIAEFTRHHIRRENAVWKLLGSEPSSTHMTEHSGLVAELELISARWQGKDWTITDDILRIRPLLDAHIHGRHAIKHRHTYQPSAAVVREPVLGGSANGA